MTDVDEKRLREKAVEALADSEPDWTYIDGPLVGDVCVETRPKNPGRSKIRVDPNALGPYIAAASPSTVIALLDRIAALESARDEACDVAWAHIQTRLDAMRHVEATAEDDRILREATQAITATESELDRIQTLRLIGGK